MTVVYDPESPSLLSNQFKNHKRPIKGQHQGGYLRTWFNGRLQFAHRIIWQLFNGPIPEGMEIDHEDRNKLNNLIGNLRLVTKSQQNTNRGNYGKYPKYISETQTHYMVQFQTEPKVRRYFKTLEEAITFRDEEANRREICTR